MNITVLNEAEFKALKPKEKKAYFDKLMQAAKENQVEASRARNGQTQGNAFLWISLFGKDAISRSFRTYVKNHTPNKLLKNYRGTTNAWYFGSQSNLGVYDGLKALAAKLNSFGIPAYVCDEWD
ncbi:hypothetical protein D051_0853 [Vibrio parahaemolyticus VPCR-2010]|uniref:hypothetical protein n=1 Tax=Vibrio parahaemolyticus TaxID=670 RepID=UPI00038E5BAE|nr:hypothetical protein D051_0853 [Vibrio parahaemolyticus VPCR-2010]